MGAPFARTFRPLLVAYCTTAWMFVLLQPARLANVSAESQKARPV